MVDGLFIMLKKISKSRNMLMNIIKLLRTML